jgi:hypothetical protein
MTSFDSSSVTSASPLPEAIPLRLPSALPSFIQKTSPFQLVPIESRCRLAQANDALSELRRLLRVTMTLGHYKTNDVPPSQQEKTRASKLTGRFWDKVYRCAERYKVARNSLLALDPMGEWKTYLLELKDDDIRSPRRKDDESEGYREVPWIWRVTQQLVQGKVSSPEQIGSMSKEELDSCEHVI